MQTAAAVDITFVVPGLLGPGTMGPVAVDPVAVDPGAMGPVAIDSGAVASGVTGGGRAGSIDAGAADALVAGLDIHGLDRLLARARLTRTPDADGTFEMLCFRSFGYESPPAGTDWPVAAFTALVDRVSGDPGTLLRADPVHLRADVADLVLFDATDAGISADEARSLSDTVNAALGPDGPLVHAAHPLRWYVALDGPARIATTPLSLATGGPISPAMPRGPDAPWWHRWMNEVQMALHECPVNEEREGRGAAPINSLWPWGGGRPSPVAGTSFTRAWSDDALVHGLACHAGVECGALPAGADAWLDGDPSPGSHLFAWDALHRAARRLDLEAWRGALERFSHAWAAPLLAALDAGRVERVSMLDERGHRFAATRRGRFQLRRRGGLAQRMAAASRADEGSGG